MANATTIPQIQGKEFDPMNIEQVINPWPWLAAARKESPVFYSPKLGAWCVTRYDDIMSLIKDPKYFSNSANHRLRPLSPALQAVYPNGHPSKRSMVRMDPPDHTRFRKIANRGMTPGIISTLEPKIRNRCNLLIDEFIGDKECDFVSQFSSRLPVQVILDFIGAPEELENDVNLWAKDFLFLTEGGPELTKEIEYEMIARAKRVVDWIYDYIEERRVTDKHDLISSLIRATGDDGEPALSNDEIISLINAFFSAGHETSAITLTLLIREFMNNPELWEKVKSQRSLIPNAVEETLRFWSPARVISRSVTKDTAVHGVVIPEGSTILLFLNSANHDETVFENPDVFDIERKNADKNIAFGFGIHFCIGASLARLEGRVALETLVERIPNLRRKENQKEDWIAHHIIPRPKSMLLDWS